VPAKILPMKNAEKPLHGSLERCDGDCSVGGDPEIHLVSSIDSEPGSDLFWKRDLALAGDGGSRHDLAPYYE